MEIYAGLDVDFEVKLFQIRNGKPVALAHGDWVNILDRLGLEMGTMVKVTFNPDLERKS
jgi:hypothetical protein